MAIVVVIIGIVLWLSHSKTGTAPGSAGGGFKIPSWLFKGIGIFLIVMLISNISDLISVVRTEGNSWWPIIKENGQNISKWLRELVGNVTGG